MPVKPVTKEEILDVDGNVVIVGHIIRQYNDFFEVVEDEDMLKGKPMNCSRVIYLPNHNGHVKIIGFTIRGAAIQTAGRDKEIDALKKGVVDSVMPHIEELLPEKYKSFEKQLAERDERIKELEEGIQDILNMGTSGSRFDILRLATQLLNPTGVNEKE